MFHCFVEHEIHVTAMVSFVPVLFIYEHYLGFQASLKLPFNLYDICFFDAWSRTGQLEHLSMGVLKIIIWRPPHNVFEPGWEKKLPEKPAEVSLRRESNV